MRFHFSDTRRAKRLARALQKELTRLGLDVGLTGAQDIAARLYGYDSFHELKASVGKREASAWDEQSPPAVADARREFQRDALMTAAGIGRTGADAIIALIRPTGMREGDGKNPRGTAKAPAPAIAATADLDALLDEIEGQIDVGVSSEIAAYVDGALIKAYLGGYDCLYLQASGYDYTMHSRRFGKDQRLGDGRRPEFDEIVRYLARKAWLDPSAIGESRGKFTFRHAGEEIAVALSLHLGDRFSMVDVEFATPRRRLPTLELFSIMNSQDWLGTFMGTAGLHLVCARDGSMPLLEALTRKLTDDGHQVWGLRSQLEFVVPAPTDGERPNVAIIRPDHPKEVIDKTIESIGHGSHVVWVVDASSLQEALLLLRGIGYAKPMIKEQLRSMLFPVHHDRDRQDTCYNWEAQVFPAKASVGDRVQTVRDAITLKPEDIIVGEITDDASLALAREAALAGHGEWLTEHAWKA